MAAMMADKPYDKQLLTYTAQGESKQCYGFGSYVATQRKTESQEVREYNERHLTKALKLLKTNQFVNYLKDVQERPSTKKA